MLVGFVPDTIYGGWAILKWHQGAPQSSFWRVTKVEKTMQRAIQAYRCTVCGYLELHAK
jgi:hypothetical protein